MKKNIIILISISLIFSMVSCNSNSSSEKKDVVITTQTDDVLVYYFHYSHRCETCIAVEEESKNALNNLYPKKMEAGEIIFQSIDMDEKEGEELAKTMEIPGQTLIFIKNDKSIDITNEGFLYAVTNPEKLKSKIKETIDELLK